MGHVRPLSEVGFDYTLYFIQQIFVEDDTNEVKGRSGPLHSVYVHEHWVGFPHDTVPKPREADRSRYPHLVFGDDTCRGVNKLLASS